MANIDIARRVAGKALPLVQVVGKARARLTTSAVASVDSIGRRADAYWQVGSPNCAGKKPKPLLPQSLPLATGTSTVGRRAAQQTCMASHSYSFAGPVSKAGWRKVSGATRPTGANFNFFH